MCVPLDHRERLVSTYSLHGRKINTSLYKVGDRSVAQRVPKYLIGVQASGCDNAAKRFAHVNGVPRLRSR